MIDMEGAIRIEPFPHQVGGSSGVMQLNKDSICKPTSESEKLFYERLPEALRGFTPEYRGTVEVKVEEDARTGVRTLMAQRVASRNKQGKSDEEGFVNNQSYSSNPWSLKIHQRQMNKFVAGEKHHYIVLENVTRKFVCPCIVDLKMGTRQHGDAASPCKAAVRMERCAGTTSGLLGARVCGMQVYDAHTRRYARQDKYAGRLLDSEGFAQTIRKFVGDDRRRDVVGPLVAKVNALSATVSRLHRYRFYGSSLLIMYEGNVPEDRGTSGGCVAEMDASAMGQGGTNTSGSLTDVCDDSTVKKTLGNCEGTMGPCEGTMRPCEGTMGPCEGTMGPCLASSIHDGDGKESDVSQLNGLSREMSPGMELLGESPGSQSLVDVRMIDFENSKCPDSVGNTSTGPDTGYLLGLQSILNVLNNIINSNSN